MNLFEGSQAGQVKIGDVAVNRIGLGTNRLTDTPENREFLHFAVDNGINFIDTAHLYTSGASETTIGSALAPFAADLIIATKGGYNDGSGYNSETFIRSNLEESLAHLKTDCITLYQLHRIDPAVPLAQTMALFKSFQAEGKIQHVGLSEATIEQIEEARRHAQIVSVQNQYSLTNRQHEGVLEYCAANGIIFIPWFPLRDVNGDPDLRRRLQPIADKYEVNVQQLVLAWLLKKSPLMLPIPGTLDQRHLKENTQAAAIVLDDEDFAKLEGF